MKKIKNYTNKLLMFEIARLRTVFNNLEKADWCSKAGGKWITHDSQHLCVGIKNWDEVPGKIKDIAPGVDVDRDGDRIKLESKFGFLSAYKGQQSIAREDPEAAYIHLVDIKPEYQKKSLGSMLVNKMEQELRKEDIKWVYVDATPTSVGFWNKMGYNTYGEKPDDPKKVRLIWNLNRRKRIGVKKSNERNEENDNFRNRIVKRYRLIVDEYNSRKLRWYWSKHKLDQLIKDEQKEDLEKKTKKEKKVHTTSQS